MVNPKWQRRFHKDIPCTLRCPHIFHVKWIETWKTGIDISIYLPKCSNLIVIPNFWFPICQPKKHPAPNLAMVPNMTCSESQRFSDLREINKILKTGRAWDKPKRKGKSKKSDQVPWNTCYTFFKDRKWWFVSCVSTRWKQFRCGDLYAQVVEQEERRGGSPVKTVELREHDLYIDLTHTYLYYL